MQQTNSIKIGKANLPINKNVYYALTGIPGIGYVTSAKICALFNIDKRKRLSQLTESELMQLDKYLSNDYYVLDSVSYPLYKYVKYNMTNNIKQKIKMDTIEGKNHAKGYRVHNQKRK